MVRGAVWPAVLLPALLIRGAASLSIWVPSARQLERERQVVAEQEMYDRFRSVAAVADRVKGSGRAPVIMHIGTGCLANANPFSDVDLYNRLSSLVSIRGFRLVLVEPSTRKNPQIWSNLRRTGFDADKAQVVNAFVGGRCPNRFKAMYYFLPDLVSRDFRLTSRAYQGWQSSDQKAPLLSLHGYVRSLWPGAPEWEGWKAFQQAENASKYVGASLYRCLSPAALLEEAHVNASDIAMLVVDAEGEDLRIVDAFSGLPQFRPGYLQYEDSAFRNARRVKEQSLNYKMRALGYNVGRGGEAGNILATLRL
mmetsp:Transcript_95384/g.269982  ORF Transcript_95384/g.269982 Transcript_95384/m.269982 type:complete len:309 (-) Transcript_95384:80-1006(-)